MYTNETSPTSPGFPPPFQDVQWPGDLGQDLLPIATQIQSKSVTSVLNRTSLPVGIPSMVSDSWGSGWAYGGAGNTHAWAGSSSGLLPLPPRRHTPSSARLEAAATILHTSKASSLSIPRIRSFLPAKTG